MCLWNIMPPEQMQAHNLKVYCKHINMHALTQTKILALICKRRGIYANETTLECRYRVSFEIHNKWPML